MQIRSIAFALYQTDSNPQTCEMEARYVKVFLYRFCLIYSPAIYQSLFRIECRQFIRLTSNQYVVNQ